MENKFFLENLNVAPLSAFEEEVISGGESLWYWIAYGVGYVAKEITEIASNASKIPPHKVRGDY